MSENVERKFDFQELVKAGVVIGHQTSRWCPKMAPYIWGQKNNVHLIDVSKTAFQLEKAAKFLESVAAEGKSILWVGTKKAAQDVIHNTAKSLSMPYVNHRWIGGTLSNNSQVKKSVTKLLHYEDVVSRAEKFPHYTKKEFNLFQKMIDRLEKNVGGIRTLHWPIGALVLIDVTKERSALKEAAATGIPVVAIVDTNGDPSLVNYVIPANDDAPRALKILMDYLAAAVAQGKVTAKQKGKEKVAVKEQASKPVDETVALALAQAARELEEETTKSKRKSLLAEKSKKVTEVLEAETKEKPE